MLHTDLTSVAILANLTVLTSGLQRAATLSSMAAEAMNGHHRNLAIGTILPLEAELPALNGLLAAILILHRTAGQGGVS